MANSNQRITKIKLDTVLDLLEKAESIPVEDATVIDAGGSDLVAYPDIASIRFWTRDNILKGITGIMPMYNPSDFTGKLVDSSSYNPEQIASMGLTTILDGLVLETRMHKRCITHDSVEELVPKPGLQLSNLLQHINFTAPVLAYSSGGVVEAFPSAKLQGVLMSLAGARLETYNNCIVGDVPYRTTIVSHQVWKENKIACSYWRGFQVDSSFICCIPRAYEILEESETVAEGHVIWYIQAGPRLRGTYYDTVSFEAMTNTQRWNWFKSHQKEPDESQQNLFYSFPVIPANYLTDFYDRNGGISAQIFTQLSYRSYPGDETYLANITEAGYVSGNLYAGQMPLEMSYWYIC